MHLISHAVDDLGHSHELANAQWDALLQESDAGIKELYLSLLNTLRTLELVSRKEALATRDTVLQITLLFQEAAKQVNAALQRVQSAAEAKPAAARDHLALL